MLARQNSQDPLGDRLQTSLLTIKILRAAEAG